MPEPWREDQRDFRVGCAAHGGSARAWFEAQAAAVVDRMLQQDGGPAVAPTVIRTCVSALWDAAGAIGWPASLPDGVTCRSAETPGAALEPKVVAVAAQVESDAERARLLPVLRQLLKACVYPEFTECRDSYRATGADGRCARQQRAVAAARISGSPCVDCPYFVARTETEHRDLLLAGWRVGSPDVFRGEPSVFLPNDFRALRRFLWLRSRYGSA